MLHFERELHIVNLQQSLSGKQPQHRLPPMYVPQHPALSPLPIYNPYFVRPRPVPQLRPNRTPNQPPVTQSASSPQLPAPVLPIMNPDHPPSHSTSHLLTHLTTHLPTHLVTSVSHEAYISTVVPNLFVSVPKMLLGDTRLILRNTYM